MKIESSIHAPLGQEDFSFLWSAHYCIVEIYNAQDLGGDPTNDQRACLSAYFNKRLITCLSPCKSFSEEGEVQVWDPGFSTFISSNWKKLVGNLKAVWIHNLPAKLIPICNWNESANCGRIYFSTGRNWTRMSWEWKRCRKSQYHHCWCCRSSIQLYFISY